MTRSSLKVWLALGTALGSAGGLAASAAQAQNVQLPRAADGTTVARSTPGLDAGISRNGNTLNVQLRAAATVIEWNGFNVPENATADFRTALPVDVAVLNRDVSGNSSQLLGRITSDDNVAVWIMNPNGILAGSRAVFSTGSLVLTTLDVNQADFLANGRNFRLNAPDARTAGIDIANGARIQTEDGPRGLVMVAPRIDVAGDFNAGDADVAFVTASDVTLTYDPNSPLSVTLNRGTAVPGRSQYVRGSVAGADAIFALASQATVTDALLQVDARVTTALAGTRGIVLSAGRPATPVAGVTTSPVTGAADGVVSLSVGGALTTNDMDGGSDILAGASGSAAFTGALSTNRDVVIASGGALSVTDVVTADRDYRLSGAGITLGDVPVIPSTPPVAVVQQAGGAIDLRSVGGDISGLAGLTLRSETNGITMTTAGTGGGDVAFAASTLVEAGRDRSDVLQIALGDAVNSLVLGDVRAEVLRGGMAGTAVGDRLVLGTAVTLGDVDTRRALDVAAAGLVAGNLVSDRGVTLDVTGALDVGTVRARGGSAILTGTGDTAVTGLVSANGTNADVRVTRAGVLTVADLTATRDVSVDARAGSATVAGNVAAGLTYTVSGGTVVLGGDANARQSAQGSVRVTGGSGGITGNAGLTLLADADRQGNDTLSLAIDPFTGASGGAISFASRSLVAGGVEGTADVLVRSADANGAVTLGDVVARRLLGGVGTDPAVVGVVRNAAITAGDLNVRDDLLLRGTSVTTGGLTSANGLVRVTGAAGSVTTNDIVASDAAIITASGDASLGRVAAGAQVRVDAGGALVMRSDVDAGTDLRLAGASVVLGGGRYASDGTIDVRAAVGGITSTAPVTLESSGSNAADFIRLQSVGTQGIVLASDSRIVAGTDRALRVGVFNAAADAPLALGDVSARSLGALAALDGDAARPAGAIVAGGDLRFERLDLVDGFSAESSGGDLSIQAIAVTGAGAGISLKAAGALDVQRNVSASGDVLLASGTDLTLGMVESRNGRATVSSGGVARVDTLAGTLGATLDGTTISAREVRGGTVRATASQGDATLGQVTGTSVTVSAANLASVGGLTAVGNAQVTGGEVRLSGTHAATGRYAATATGGALRGAAGLSITANSDNLGTEGLALSATGGPVLLDGSSQIQGSAAVSVTTDGAAIALGAVRAASLTISGATNAGAAVRTGDIVLAGDLSLAAANGVTMGSVAARTVQIDGGLGDTALGALRAGAVALRGANVSFGGADVSTLTATALVGDVTGGAVTATGAVRVVASGAATLGQVAGSTLNVRATRDVRLGGLVVAGDATASGRSIVLGDTTVGSLDATASMGDITGGSIAASDAVRIRATGAVRLARVAGSTLDAGAGGALQLGDLAVGGSATLNGQSVVLGDVTVGSLAATASTGEVTGGAVTATDAVQIVAGGAATLGSVSGSTLNIGAAGAVRLGELDVVGAAKADGQSVSLENATVGSLSATSRTGDVTGGIVTAIDTVQVTSGGSATFGAVSGSTLNIGAANAVRLGELAIGGGATLNGQSVVFGDASVGSLGATALTGDVTGGTVVANGAVRVTAGAAVALGEVAASTLDVGAAAAVRVGGLTVEGTAKLRGFTASFGAANVGSLDAAASGGEIAGGDVTARGTFMAAATGATTFGRVTAAGNADVTAGGAITLGGFDGSGTATLSAAGDVLARDGIVAVEAVKVAAGGDIRAPFIRSTAGDLTVAAPTGDVTGFAPDSGIALSAGPGGMFSLTAGRRVVLGDLGGGSVLVEAPTLSVGAVDAGTGAVTLRASNGGLTVAGPVVGGVVTLEAMAGLALNDVAAGGTLSLAGGAGDIGFGVLSGASIRATTSGVVSGTAVRSAGGVTVNGGSVALGAVEAGAATLTAAAGDLAIGTLVTGGDALLSAANVLRTTGEAAVGGAYRLSGTSISLGAASQRAAGEIRIVGGTGGIAAGPGLVLSGAQVTLDTSGGIAMAGSRVQTPGTLAVRAGRGAAIGLGGISAGSVAGFDGTGAARELTHDGSFTAEDVSAGTMALRLTAGNLTLGRVTSGGAVSLATATGTIGTGALDVGTLAIDGGGAVSAGPIGVRGTATVTGAALTLGDVRAGTLAIRSAGALGGANGVAPSVTTTSGDLSVDARTMRLGATGSAGAVTLKGETIDVVGRLSAARQALVEARAALTLGDVAAGDALTLTAGGALVAATASAGGSLSASGAGVSIAAIDTRGALDVKSSGGIRLGRTVAAGAATLNAAGTATLDALSAGASITLTADDAELGGAVRAANVTVATRTPATTALRIGDGTASDGFKLSAAEIDWVTTDRLRLDAGAGAMEIGTIAFETGGAVEALSTGDVRVTGPVSASGAGRSFRIGGDTTDAAMASSITLASTSDAGGRLLLEGHDLELRGGRIAAGLVPGFIDTLQPGAPGLAQAASLIGSGNSALFNAQFGGGFFAPAANTTLAARSLTVRFGDFALFQNTGIPGSFAGVVLGTTPATPGLTPLRVSSSSQGQTSFAVFGTINGINGAGAALLGREVIDIEPRLLATSRINGCLAGSGAGCLTTIVIQPTLQVFDWDSEDVFGISQDVAVPFDPIVGGNNEGLLTSLPELAPSADVTPIVPLIKPPAVFRTIPIAPVQETPLP